MCVALMRLFHDNQITICLFSAFWCTEMSYSEVSKWCDIRKCPTLRRCYLLHILSHCLCQLLSYIASNLIPLYLLYLWSLCNVRIITSITTTLSADSCLQKEGTAHYFFCSSPFDNSSKISLFCLQLHGSITWVVLT